MADRKGRDGNRLFTPQMTSAPSSARAIRLIFLGFSHLHGSACDLTDPAEPAVWFRRPTGGHAVIRCKAQGDLGLLHWALWIDDFENGTRRCCGGVCDPMTLPDVADGMYDLVNRIHAIAESDFTHFVSNYHWKESMDAGRFKELVEADAAFYPELRGLDTP